jgi:long-chain fatty acid transport protein
LDVCPGWPGFRGCFGRLGGILAVLAAFTAGAGTARASGFAAARFGGEHGHVTTTNPTALYFNPAGIAFSSGTALYGDGTLALRRATWTREASGGDAAEPPGTEGANVGEANLSNVFGGPMLGASTRLGSFALGLALSVPFGGRARWGRNPRFEGHAQYPLAADGVQRWHGIEGRLTFIYGTLGLAYRFGRVAVGLTGNLIRSSMYSRQAKTPTGDGSPDTTREGRAILDVRGTHASFAAGALIELVQARLWLGGSYQAQPALGPMQLSGTITQEYQGQRTPFPVTLTQALPDVVRVGTRWRPAQSVELRLSGELTRWSLMQTQCAALEGSDCLVDSSGADASMGLGVLQNLRRRWNDTYGVRAGASFWARPTLELFAGVGVENGATPDDTLDPALGDADNGTGTLGVRFQATRGLLVSTSYSHIQYRARDNRGKSQLSTAAAPTRRPDGGGRYTQWIGLFNLNLEQRF